MATLVLLGACTGSGSGPDDPTPSPDPTVTAGNLDGKDLPDPEQLGEGWTTGQTADGHGELDGDWLVARDPGDLNAALPPIGCLGITAPPAYPQPVAALQGTYIASSAGLDAVVISIQYASEAEAVAFMQSYARDISACPPPASPTDAYVRAITVEAADDARIVDRWVESGVGAAPHPWRELIVRSGPKVALANVQVPAGSPFDAAGLETVLRDIID